jgi:hypothetical protein
MAWVLTAAVSVGTTIAAASVVYLDALVVAAAASRLRRPQPQPSPSKTSRLVVVLVPAHNEAEGISTTLASLEAQVFPDGSLEVIVVADNCTDDTAAVAARHNVTVWSRDDADRRGKGHALAWAFARLADERPADIVVVVDADCIASVNLVSRIARALNGATTAVQAAYRVNNAAESTESALRAGGFVLMHDIRAAGKDAIGLSCGLFGTGMAFSTALLREIPWSGAALTEDTEYHLRLVCAGVVVRYVSDAFVTSPMPTTADSARAQHLRWEGGNAALSRNATPELLAAGLRGRDLQVVHVALERLVPPQSLLAAITMSATTAAVALRRPLHARLGAAALIGQGGYVVGGLIVGRAPLATWLALAHAPGLIARRVGLAAEIARRGVPAEWTRTDRGRV